MAAFKLGNRIKCATATTGTGTVTIGSPEDGFQSFTAGGIANGEVVRYVITEGSAFEIGNGTFTTSGATLTRTLLESSTGSLLNLSGDAIVFVSPSTEDLVTKDASTGDVDLGASKLYYANVFSATGDLPSASTYHGMFAHVHGTGAAYFSHAAAWYRLVNYDSNGDIVPLANDSDDLGTDTNKWKNAHISGYVNAPYWRSDKDSADYAYFDDGNSRLCIHFDGDEDFRFSDGGALLCNGDITAFSSTIASDERLKENIEVVDGLDKVMQLNGVTFNWKRDGKASAGVIAQQVQKVLPQAVGTTVNLETDEEHLVVDYNAIIAVLIESVKELKAEVEELKNATTSKR